MFVLPIVLLLAQPVLAPDNAPKQPTEQPAPMKEAPKDAGKWDVNSPPGANKQVSLDVTEGTWLSLDLSPDGKTIAFDLLGDIYTMPASGGEAKSITSGVAWDMQPRFSPDGKFIAFTSDRGGGDNIWVMGADGTSPRQITKENYRLTNSPAWTPDGQFIVAHKHFSSRRSLGAGEMWLYHVSGGFDGLQMTTKPTDQKDVGEPMFSPDGRYLYYSWDSTPGGSFEYNKDSNAGIYSINRLDRQTGENETIISGPGGAIRPTPSPDGKSLAFVRRVRFKTVLFVRDLASGRERAIYDNLERDMQETWAIHGVYPSFAWTPDSGEIVFYAKGGFHRINVGGGTVTDIPFHVKDSRTVFDAVRFPVEVAPAEFDVKLLQNVSVRPDGKQVAYSALGHVYVRDLPEGAPKRLTAQNDRFEFMPAYSRDGASIAFATWNDDELGSIRVVSNGQERTITPEKGHYVDPAFSPDGQWIVFGKVSGGYLSSPLWSNKPGLYKAPAAGGSMEFITRKGTNAQFGAASDRMFVTTVEGQKDVDRRCLLSMKLDGTDERVHYVSEAATEYRLSPDGRWLAFVERFNIYITPFVATGREIAIGPKSNSQPVAKVSKDAGVNLQWSGDASSLNWSLGPQSYSRRLDDSFAFISGKKAEELPPPPATGVNISFKAPFDAPKGTVALVGGTLITMAGDRASPTVIENGTVVIEGNRIVSVGAGMAPPAGAKVIDCKGKFIMPGMIDVHAHGGQGVNGFTPQNNWVNLANLAFGVTTIHDPSNDTESIFTASEMRKAGEILGPRIFSTGTILYGASGSFKAEIDSLDDALFHLRRMKAVGAFSVKSYNQPRREQRQQVIEAARQLQMMVVPEGGSLYQHNMTMVIDGHTGVEHTLPVERIYNDAAAVWGASKTGYTPTLIVAYGGLDGEHYFYDTTNVWENTRLLTYVPRFVVDPRSRRRETAPKEEYNALHCSGIAKRIVDAGGRAQLGAHGQLAGLGAHWELWLLASGGMTPMEALRAATLDGAFYLGLDKDLGSIEAGKLADMVVLDQNPLTDIHNSQAIRYTVANGRVYDAANLACIAPDAKPAPTLWFTELQKGAGASITMRRFVSSCAGCGIPGGGCDSPYAHEQTGPSGYR
ncbi:MAG: PD40 domain-containing protein [Planctomycetes bacterium]|nr:PD40 domain-containing protein [Planctomycetota bacterium]